MWSRTVFCLTLFSLFNMPTLFASDHDDGEMELKGRSLNITDVFAFREDNQSGNAADKGNLVLVMNVNPRSLPSQAYYFSTQARYEFHLTRVPAGDKTKKPTGKDDITLRFSFSDPDAKQEQKINMEVLDGGAPKEVTTAADMVTTNLADSKSEALKVNEFTIGGKKGAVFAGLREDPFFFDVEQFFKVRSAAIATKKFIGFNPANTAKDFTNNYNVNSIVVRMPIAALQTSAAEPVFDVWTTVSVPK